MLFILSLVSVVAAAGRSVNGTSGCGLKLPEGLKPGGDRVNFTDFASNSSKDNPRRAYSVVLPANFSNDVPTPLILGFHGRGQDNDAMMNTSMLSDPYFNTNAITVYPMGINKTLTQKLWQGDPDVPSSINDTTFIAELIPSLKAQFCIAPDAVFAAGLSNGGGFLTYLACNQNTSSQITAFGAAPLSYFNGTNLACYPKRTATPILEMHGGADTWVVYNGGPDKNRDNLTTEGIPDWLADWCTRNDCPSSSKAVEQYSNKTNGFGVKHITWNCTGRVGLVTHYYSDISGHVWPTDKLSGYNGTSKMLEFFYQWAGKNLTPAAQWSRPVTLPAS